MATHRAVAITTIGSLQIVDVPTPTPEADEVLVHVHYTALIAFDGYQHDRGFLVPAGDYPHAIGIASAGLVKAVGENVKDFKEGDRVAVFNRLLSKTKGAQEYTVVPRWNVAKVPETVPLHKAASIPDNYVTAMFTVFGTPNLALPVPPSLVSPAPVPARAAVDLSAPVLVYGAGSSSGQFFIQALRLAGFTDIFAVASSKHHEYLRTLGATQCFDYRSPDVVAQIRAAATSTKHERISIALDPIAARGSLALLSEVLASPTSLPPARLAALLPFKDGDSVTNGIDADMSLTVTPWVEGVFAGKNIDLVPVGTFHFAEDDFSRENVMLKILPRLLAEGQLRANPVRLLKEGPLLERVKAGLDLLRNNKISGEKVVVELKF
ncbi:zinc-binding alcohol dehydrogenase family protein [Phanerochaete sordida]|uniref:Zinc-binding alcohol dehydrogenase family protein n=1 Tax=Phanerochaete sordida TaxID=48140 RepID=A0A9P3GE79_9APHY|nr:zinc-binding alcohol dehydrogenase family protein [Phanerochaete sordida]